MTLAPEPSNCPGNAAGGVLFPLIMSGGAGLALGTADVLSSVWGFSQGGSGRAWSSSSVVTRLRWEMEQQQFGHGQEEKIEEPDGKRGEGRQEQITAGALVVAGGICVFTSASSHICTNTNISEPLTTCLLLLLPFCLIHVEGRLGITTLQSWVEDKILKKLRGT